MSVDCVPIEIIVYSVTEEGGIHLIDIRGADKPGRATWGKVWPVMSTGKSAVAEPLKPGETREFSIDIPYSFDDPPDVDPELFGGKASNVRFFEK